MLSIHTHLVATATEEHLQIIRQGVDVWKEWRQKNAELFPDLRGALLIGTLLTRANLGGADLCLAKLIATFLSGRTSAGRTSAGRTSAGRTSAGRTSAGRTSKGLCWLEQIFAVHL